MQIKLELSLISARTITEINKPVLGGMRNDYSQDGIEIGFNFFFLAKKAHFPKPFEYIL